LHQRALILAAVIAVRVLHGPAPALAQDQGGICTIANTCSEAFFQCVAVNCPAILDARCSGLCQSRFDGCMRTGAFGGRDCRRKTLVRR
jgi:hypothetical protein